MRGTDEGIWRRLVVIPFERTFGVNLDPRLADELKAEMPGILAWALHGAQQWFATHAIPVPDAFTAPTRTYRMDQDPVRAFLNDCTDQMPDAKVEATALHQAYTRWCDEQGRAALAQGEFGRRMTMLHGPSAKGGKAKRARYDGLRLKADDAAQEVIPLPGIGDAEERVA